jgi:hypothetical protein
MIFATVQELEKYDIMCEGQQAGIYSTYFGRSPVLFNLITRTSLVPFQFEPFNNGEAPFFLIDRDELYEKTLPQKVGGRTVDRLCCELSPIQMRDFFRDHQEDLPALGVTEYWYNKVDLLLAVMTARALQWKKYQRGQLAREGKIIRAQFGSMLEKGEEAFLLKMNPYHRDFKEVG